MNSYYIKYKNTNKLSTYYAATPAEIVKSLEYMCKQITNKNRKSFMIEMVSLGHGYDDPDGIYFTQLMADKVEIGVVTKDGRFKQCNIHEHARNFKYRTEMGD